MTIMVITQMITVMMMKENWCWVQPIFAVSQHFRTKQLTKEKRYNFSRKAKPCFKTHQSDDTTPNAKILAAWDEGCRPLQNFPPNLVHQPLWVVHPIYNSCKKHFPTEFSGPCRNIMFLKDLFAENVFSLHPISSSMCSLGTPPCCFALSRTLANSHSLGLFLAFCVQFLK